MHTYRYSVKMYNFASFTWKSNLQQDCLLPVFDTADLLELHVKDEEKDACQKGYEPNGDSVIAGIIVLVENTMESLTSDVNVAFIYYGAKYNHWENLEWRREA